MRQVLQLAYDGTHYHGWQVQDNAKTVQGVLNEALGGIFEEKIETTGCGRTDTGVHAGKFYAHFDSEQTLPDKLERRLNLALPSDIRIQKAIIVPDEFHVRFDAVSRSYDYFIHSIPDPFLENYSLLLYNAPDFTRMNEAASLLLHQTDFGCFGKNGSGNYTNFCTVTDARWISMDADNYRDGRHRFHITANRFLRGMVRAIVGTLLDIGYGKMSLEEFRQVLQSSDRGQAGKSALPHALFLSDIRYNLPALSNDHTPHLPIIL
jgi:tRNA pseudouridine38-40 synthase